MSRQYSLDRNALLKILLHSLKFPTTPVSGFLLGEERAGGALPGGSTSAGGASRATLHIYDAAPVTHTFLTLSLPLDIALAQLQEHCKTQGKVRVVGYYQCNERLDDSDLADVGRKIATKVEALFPGSVALVLDGRATESLLSSQTAASTTPTPPMKLLHKDARGWVNAPSTGAEAVFTCPTSGIADLLAAYVEEGRHQRLNDFEDHLENISLDWLNADLLA